MKYLEVGGSPREIGQKHGEEFRREIHELFEIRNELLLKKYMAELDPNEVRKLAALIVDTLRKDSRAFEEFEGIAEGARLSPIDLMILNNYTDIRDFDRGHLPDLRSFVGGCSIFSLNDGKKVVCGQTWDMHLSATPYLLHLKVNDDDGISSEVLTVMGCMGLAGVSSQNVSVLINNLHSTDPIEGLMWPALVRGMLRQKNAEDSVAYFKKNLPCSGHNYLVSDEKGHFNIETTGKEFEVTYSSNEKGVVFHTNHFVGKLRKYETENRRSQTTFKRYDNMKAYFSEDGAFKKTVNQIAEGLFSESSNCTVYYSNKEPHGPGTCGGILIDHGTRKGESFSGSYGSQPSHHFSW